MNPLIIQKSIAVCNYIIINKLNQINLLNNQSLEKRYESRKIKKNHFRKNNIQIPINTSWIILLKCSNNPISLYFVTIN